MTDVRDLLTSTTPEPTTLRGLDLDAVARRGARRRVGKRLGAVALSLALVAGTVGIATELFDAPETPFIDALPGGATWEPLPDAPLSARANPQVLPVDDGRIVVAGGTDVLDAGGGSVRFLAGAAVLDADRASWTSLPELPFATVGGEAAGRPVQFTLRGRTLWAHATEVFSPARSAGAPDASGSDLARLDLDDPTGGWEQLPEPPLAGTSVPLVTIVDDVVVVLGGFAMDAGNSFDTAGAVWRNGAWSAFDSAPLDDVTAPFVGVSADHVAIAGGEGDAGTTAAAAVLDLDVLEWRRAEDHPLGPRAWLHTEVNTLVVDGRMLVAGGIAERGAAGMAPDGAAPAVPTEELCIELPVGSAADDPNLDVSGELSCSDIDVPDEDGVTADVAPAQDVLAPGIAWLDLSSGTWDVVEPDATTVHGPLRPDGLTAPSELSLPVAGPGASDGPRRVLPDGRTIPAVFPPQFPTAHVEHDGEEPTLAFGDSFSAGPDTRVALALDDGGGWAEVTLPGPLEGVTYTLVDGDLFAVGGLPYEFVDGADPSNAFADRTYDRSGSLEVRVLRP